MVDELVKNRTAKGDKSRAVILDAAAKLATTHGLEGLSIGDLAKHLKMSKSGLYAHFESKEELQLAAIQTAIEIFQREVVASAMEASDGLKRLNALVDGFLSHLQRRVFPGGCFFAQVSAELDSRPGRARDRVAQFNADWFLLLEQCIRDAQAKNEIDSRAEPSQLAFEIQSMLLAGNFQFVMTGEAALTRARHGVEDVLARFEVKPALRRRLGVDSL